jgi:hypothetical protein
MKYKETGFRAFYHHFCVLPITEQTKTDRGRFCRTSISIRAERFCDGALLGFFEKGCVGKWLERLKEIDGN